MYQFHNDRKEITFDNYNTPTPWMNYLSNGTFHTMISQAGGGVAFYKSPQIWRINHYRFFHLPMDRSGFYTYINDNQDIWCPTSEPCKNKPDAWKATHGMGYTTFYGKKNDLEVTATYLVGKQEDALIWNLKLKSSVDKKITMYPYVELGMMEFMRELQWQCYNKHQLSVYNREDILIYHYGVEEQPQPSQTPLVFFASNVDISGFDCDRDEFIGSYRSEENPICVEKNGCSGSTLYGGDPCFALQIEVALKAGVENEINIFLGTAMTEEDVQKAVHILRQEDFVAKSLKALAENWEDYFDKFQCELPDKDAETMINIWNPYQLERNFQFSRNISYYATGTFRGVGVRDTAQDILAMIPLDLNRSKDKLNLLFTQQYQDGHCNHYFYPTEGFEPIKRIHSDNHLWLVMDVFHIVMEEGRLDYLYAEQPFYDGGKANVWDHIKRSIEFTKKNLGERGFPLMLSSDWNDMLYKVCRQGKGESIWTSMQFGTILRMMVQLSQLMNEDAAEYLTLYEEQKQLVNSIAWDGEWYRRCITDDGTFIGSKAEAQAKIWLNTQSWAVISGMGDREKQIQAMDSVKKYLNTELGIKKIHPSMQDYPSKEDPLTHYNKGCGENGSIFCHANTWAIIAECILGRSDLAYQYYHQLLPMVVQRKAGEYRYKAEPYVYASNIFGPESDKFGLANVSWLTGTAAWMYLAATQYLLGIKARWEGLEIEPCIPEEWKVVKVDRVFRGCKYHITIKNKDKKIFIKHVDGRKDYSVEI
jgi:cellobiose phosphorylase